MGMLDNGLNVETYTDSSPRIVIRITHIPTGKFVKGETVGSQTLLRRQLPGELEKLLETQTGKEQGEKDEWNIIRHDQKTI